MNAGLMVAAFIGAVAVGAVSVSISIKISFRYGLLDHPDGVRKIQDRPVPRLGGIAVALAFTAVSLVALLVVGPSTGTVVGIIVLLVALAMGLLGFLDDRRQLSPGVRIFFQAISGLAVWLVGVRVDVSGFWVVNFVLLVGWVVLVINGVNLLDNSDGLAGSTVFISSVGAVVIAVMGGQEVVALLGIALAGVVIGFLWHNWAPAKIYLGDSGAYFLGFLLAVLTVQLRPQSLSPPISMLIPILLLLLPIVDTAFVVIRRVSNGTHPFTAGRDHLSHGLQRRGLSTAASVVCLQGVSVVGVIGAVFLAAS